MARKRCFCSAAFNGPCDRLNTFSPGAFRAPASGTCRARAGDFHGGEPFPELIVNFPGQGGLLGRDQAGVAFLVLPEVELVEQVGFERGVGIVFAREFLADHAAGLEYGDHFQGAVGDPPAALFRFQQQPGAAQRQGQLGHAPAVPGHLAFRGQGAERFQVLDGLEDQAAVGAVKKIELQGGEPPFAHAQHHALQVEAADLRFGIIQPVIHAPFRVKDIEPFFYPAGPAGALPAFRGGDVNGIETLDAADQAHFFFDAAVDDRVDVVDGQAGLGDVGGHHRLGQADNS